MSDKNVSPFWLILMVPAIIISYIVKFFKKDHIPFIMISLTALIATGALFYFRMN